MKKSIKKDLKNLLLALVLGVSALTVAFLGTMISLADALGDHFITCIRTSFWFGITCGGPVALAAVAFPSTTKSLIRRLIKDVKEDE